MTGRSHCTASGCKFSAPANGPTNLVNHLKKHPVLYQQFLRRKKAIEEEEAGQIRIDAAFPVDGKIVAKRSKKDMIAECNEALAELIGATTMSFDLVDRPEFKRYTSLVAQTPNYTPPCRQTVVKEVHRYTERLGHAVQRAVQSAKSIAIAGDICTTKGLGRSYIAFTGHFFLSSQKRFVSCLLDVVEMTESHSGEYIKRLCDQVLHKFDIIPSKVSVTL